MLMLIMILYYCCLVRSLTASVHFIEIEAGAEART